MSEQREMIDMTLKWVLKIALTIAAFFLVQSFVAINENLADLSKGQNEMRERIIRLEITLEKMK
jgi:hypothetical protein